MQILKAYCCQKLIRTKSTRVFHEKHQKRVTCSDDSKLICVDDKFSKPF